MQQVSFIGAGKVAYKLGLALKEVGLAISQVYSRTHTHADQTAKALDAFPTDQLDNLSKEVDAFIIAIPDDAIETLAGEWDADECLVVHTSGKVGMEALSPCSSHYGVLYPLQTITTTSHFSWQEVPFCVEANTEADKAAIVKLAGRISNQVEFIDSRQRAVLHLAAVLTNNFTNHLLRMADQLLESENLNFDLLQPLARETIDKAFEQGPDQVQTGPAVRGDAKTMEKHLALLPDETQKSLYRLLSSQIEQQNSETKQ